MDEIIEKIPQLNDIFTSEEYEKYYTWAMTNGYTIKEIESTIVQDENGKDVQIRNYQVIEIPIESIKQKMRDERDKAINSILWRVERYNQQKQLGIKTSDSEKAYIKILQYIQNLRDIPEQPDFPFITLPQQQF